MEDPTRNPVPGRERGRRPPPARPPASSRDSCESLRSCRHLKYLEGLPHDLLCQPEPFATAPIHTAHVPACQFCLKRGVDAVFNALEEPTCRCRSDPLHPVLVEVATKPLVEVVAEKAGENIC